MSPRIPDTHAEAWALLPWIANGRIAPEDREWVETHVQSCAECRAELAAQRMIANQVQRDGATSPAPAASDEQRSFNKLWARIEASESATTPAADARSSVGASRSSRTVRWLAAAVVVQAIGLGVLGMSLRGSEGGKPDFVTVSNVEPRINAPAVRLVFAPGASMSTINTLLAHQGLSIVSGPGASGNFTAVLSADAVATGASAESVATVISKDPNVTFAQPVAR
ncbi:MAG: zf-HC2 domain-containing protein [Pseudomonadota bacterium]